MKLPQPNVNQWVVIFITTLPALFLWVRSGMYDTDRVERLAAAIVVVGLLLVWRLADPAE
mgnify:CR=1 FL=1